MNKASARATLAHFDRTPAKDAKQARARRKLADQCRRVLRGKGTPLSELGKVF